MLAALLVLHPSEGKFLSRSSLLWCPVLESVSVKNFLFPLKVKGSLAARHLQDARKIIWFFYCVAQLFKWEKQWREIWNKGKDRFWRVPVRLPISLSPRTWALDHSHKSSYLLMEKSITYPMAISWAERLTKHKGQWGMEASDSAN